MENLRRVELKTSFDIEICDISHAFYTIGTFGHESFDVPIATIFPFEDLYLHDDLHNYTYDKRWKL